MTKNYLTFMKMIPILCFSAGLLLTNAMVALPQQTRTDINPALQYYQSFILVPDLQQADKDYLFTNEWRGQKLPDRFGSLLAKYDNQFRLLRQAAQQTGHCDWGIDMSFGPATLLPQLSRNKAASQMARLRVMWDLQQGREAEARDDLLATFALARNSSRDGTLIAALVQIAMENIICSIVAENFHRFSPETLQQLVAGFDSAPPRGKVADCIVTEKAFFRDWMVNKVHDLQQATPGNETKIMAAIHELIASTEGPEEGDAKPAQASLADRVANASGGTSEGVLKLLKEEEPFYQRITQILALPLAEYEAQMKAFMVDVQNSSNPFIQPFFKGCFLSIRQSVFIASFVTMSPTPCTARTKKR